MLFRSQWSKNGNGFVNYYLYTDRGLKLSKTCVIEKINLNRFAINFIKMTGDIKKYIYEKDKCIYFIDGKLVSKNGYKKYKIKDSLK